MRRDWIFFATAVYFLSACSEQALSAQAPETTSSRSEVGRDIRGQEWRLSISDEVNKSQLPSTTNMKLMGFDVQKYVKESCVDLWRSSTCQVFAQPDPQGTLTGYLIISGDGKSYSVDSDTVTTPLGVSSKKCSIGGELEVTEGKPTSNFSGWSAFSSRDGAEGRFWFKRIGNNVKVADERWNYCYDDRHIEDVYVLIGSLTRELS